MTTSPTQPAPPQRPLPTPSGRPAALSLRTRWRGLMILGINVLVVVIVIGALLVTLLEQRTAVNRLHQTAMRQAHRALQEVQADAQMTIYAAAQQGMPTEAELERLLAAYPAFRSISAVTPDGEALVHVSADETVFPPWHDDAPLRGLAVPGSVGATWIEDGKLILAMAGDPAVEQAFTLVAAVDAAQLWEPVLSAGVGDEGYLYVLDTTGAVLAAGRGVTVDEAVDPAELAVFTGAQGGGATTRLYRGVGGQWVIGRGERFVAPGYTLVVETPYTEYSGLIVRVVGLVLGALVLTAVIGEWLIRRILRTVLTPIERLQAGAHAVAQGDFQYRVRVPRHTDRELVELGQTFNMMIERLGESQRQLDAYTNEMREIIDQRARELARKASQLEVAAEVSNNISAILDRRELFSQVVDLIRARFQVYHAELLQLEGETGRIIPCTGPRLASLPALTLRDAPHSAVAWVARHGETLYLPDVNQDERYLRTAELPASQSELAIPLKFAGNVLGVLNLEADHLDAFPADDIAVLESVASTVAVSLRNAEMFGALEVANQELVQTSLQAKQANTLKSRFLFNASHKLRTPLNSIIGYSETILSGVYGEMPDTVLDRQARILENGRILQALVEDMLDLSAIETGHLQLKLEWVSLPPLLDEVMNATRALQITAHPDHDLEFHLVMTGMEDLPPVWADVERLRYILINLTSNAVKFTEQGEVVISADYDDDWVRIHVRDTGPGISEDDVRYLFQPFQHQQGSTGLEGRGTGLGLPVSRLLAMQHGGELTVESVLYEGSVFTLNLPRHPEGAPPPE